MIPVTVLVTGRGTVSHSIKGRFGPGRPSRFSSIFRPVIVWNTTYRCNLRCIHCYIKAGEMDRSELEYSEAMRLIDEVSRINAPLLILSGGEPLLRRDLMRLARYAADRGIRLVLSSNGTLISRDVARELRDIGFMYVGISLDSPIPSWHDSFRGVRGAYDATLRGIMNCIEEDIPTGIRYTVTRYNIRDVPRIIDLAIDIGLRRVTFYHLSASGRARGMGRDWYLTVEQYTWFMDYLIRVSREYAGEIEIETTMAPFDGIYIADRIARSRSEFWRLMEVVEAQGGCGRKIISIYPDGEVYPCQFVDFMRLGNIRDNGLGSILDPKHPALMYFSETERYLRDGKCGGCPFKKVCKGGDRVRAYYLGGSIYSSDPICHLDIDEIYSRWS